MASVSATGDKHNNEKINFYPHVDDVDAVKASSKSPACRVEPNGENDFDKLISYSNQGQASTNNTPVKIAAEPSDIVNNSSIGGIIEEDEENDDRSRGDSIEGNDGMLLDVVNDLPEMQAFMEAFMFNMDDSAFMDTSYEEEAAASNSNNSESVYNLWKLVGINPVNPHLDEHKPDLLVVNGDQNKLKVIHTKAPLLGTISGTEPIYSINGERLRYNFPDISHFGCSITQAQSIGLVQLPHLYTDLYKTVIKNKNNHY